MSLKKLEVAAYIANIYSAIVLGICLLVKTIWKFDESASDWATLSS